METGDVYIILITLLTEVLVLVKFLGKHKELDALDWFNVSRVLSGTLSMVCCFVLIYKAYSIIVRGLLKIVR